MTGVCLSLVQRKRDPHRANSGWYACTKFLTEKILHLQLYLHNKLKSRSVILRGYTQQATLHHVTSGDKLKRGLPIISSPRAVCDCPGNNTVFTSAQLSVHTASTAPQLSLCWQEHEVICLCGTLHFILYYCHHVSHRLLCVLPAKLTFHLSSEKLRKTFSKPRPES